MKVEPAASIEGAVAVPGVKGISQRAVLLGAIADRSGRKRELLGVLSYVGALATAALFLVHGEAYLLGAYPLPPWLGREELHRSHRSKLVAKSPEYYAPLFPDVPDDLDYVWPVATS